MNLNLQYKIYQDPRQHQFLRENSHWYKYLNRSELYYKDFINDISKMINVDADTITDIKQLTSIEDDSLYDVWKICISNQNYILKKAKNDEIEIYNTFLKELKLGVPKLYNTYQYSNESYLLIEYIEGNELFKCNKNDLIKVIADVTGNQMHIKYDSNSNSTKQEKKQEKTSFVYCKSKSC